VAGITQSQHQPKSQNLGPGIYSGLKIWREPRIPKWVHLELTSSWARVSFGPLVLAKDGQYFMVPFSFPLL